MKRLKNVRYAIAIVAACAAIGVATDAKAQSITVDTDLVVQNTLTLAVATPLNFGTIAAISDAANTASVTISPGGTLSVATAGAPAYTALIDSALATSARVTVEDGAAGATINVNIPTVGVVNPIFGGNAFTLDSFVTSYNGAAPAARVINTPWTQVFDAAYSGGVNTLDIGATITTQTAVATYGDGAYDGGFDVTFSY